MKRVKKNIHCVTQQEAPIFNLFFCSIFYCNGFLELLNDIFFVENIERTWKNSIVLSNCLAVTSLTCRKTSNVNFLLKKTAHQFPKKYVKKFQVIGASVNPLHVEKVYTII
jgi:hypothetical protein